MQDEKADVGKSLGAEVRSIAYYKLNSSRVPQSKIRGRIGTYHGAVCRGWRPRCHALLGEDLEGAPGHPAMEERRSRERSSVAPGSLQAHMLGLAEENEETEATARAAPAGVRGDGSACSNGEIPAKDLGLFGSTGLDNKSDC